MFSGNYAHDNNIGKNTKKWDCTYRFYDEYTSSSYSRDKGVRRGTFGEYWMDVPSKNTFTFYDEDGKAVAGAKVELHSVIGQGYGNGFVSAKAKYAGKTDRAGAWTVEKPIYDEQVCWMTNAALFFLLETEDGKEAGRFHGRERAESGVLARE